MTLSIIHTVLTFVGHTDRHPRRQVVAVSGSGFAPDPRRRRSRRPQVELTATRLHKAARPVLPRADRVRPCGQGWRSYSRRWSSASWPRRRTRLHTSASARAAIPAWRSMPPAPRTSAGRSTRPPTPATPCSCCVLPAGARACASLATIAFPGSGYNVGRVSVLLPAPGVVQVAVGRNLQNVYGYYLGTSVDGGATFNTPIRIGGALRHARRAAAGRPHRGAGRRRAERSPGRSCARMAPTPRPTPPSSASARSSAT